MLCHRRTSGNRVGMSRRNRSDRKSKPSDQGKSTEAVISSIGQQDEDQLTIVGLQTPFASEA